MTRGVVAGPTEAAWEPLWSRLTLRDDFWLGFLSSSDHNLVRELERRARQYLRGKALGVEALHVMTAKRLPDALSWILQPHDPGTGLVWVVGLGNPTDWLPAWDWLLRRLNEQRGRLLQAVPRGVVLVGPEGMAPLARESAPDLWSYRIMVHVDGMEPGAADDAAVPATPTPVDTIDDRAFAERALGSAVEASTLLRPMLRDVAVQLQAGRGDRAAELALRALEQATSADDVALAEASVALALDLKGDLVGALSHATRAIDTGRPLGTPTTASVLDLLARSTEAGPAEAAARRRVALSRLVADGRPDDRRARRDLSVMLDNVGRIRQRQGDLAGALGAFEESLGLRRLITRQWGETPEALRDLSVALDNVGRIRQRQGDLAGALGAFDDSLDLGRRIARQWGETPEAVRDLSASLNNVGGIRQRQGDLAGALGAFEESLDLFRRIARQWGETPGILRDLSVSLNNVGRIRQRRGDLSGALGAFEESLGLRRRIARQWGETPEAVRDLSVSLNNVGGIREAQGDLAGALAAFEESLRWYERLADRYGEVAEPDELAMLKAKVASLTSPG